MSKRIRPSNTIGTLPDQGHGVRTTGHLRVPHHKRPACCSRREAPLAQSPDFTVSDPHHNDLGDVPVAEPGHDHRLVLQPGHTTQPPTAWLSGEQLAPTHRPQVVHLQCTALATRDKGPRDHRPPPRATTSRTYRHQQSEDHPPRRAHDPRPLTDNPITSHRRHAQPSLQPPGRALPSHRRGGVLPAARPRPPHPTRRPGPSTAEHRCTSERERATHRAGRRSASIYVSVCLCTCTVVALSVGRQRECGTRVRSRADRLRGGAAARQPADTWRRGTPEPPFRPTTRRPRPPTATDSLASSAPPRPLPIGVPYGRSAPSDRRTAWTERPRVDDGRTAGGKA